MDIPEPSPLIRSMTAETVEAVEALERECFPQPWSLDSLVEELSNPIAVFRTAEADGKVVGYVGMHHIIDEGYITNIAVAPQYRGRGIARALMKELFRYADKNKLRMLTLEVRESNEAAQKLYKHLGFERTGLRKNFYSLPTENGVIMTCEI